MKERLSIEYRVELIRGRYPQLSRLDSSLTSVPRSCYAIQGLLRALRAKYAGRGEPERATRHRADGGPGSGNHNHPGRPGQRGGSLPTASATGANVPCTGFASRKKEQEHIQKHLKEFQGMKPEEYTAKGIAFLQQPCEGNVDGYMRRTGQIVRFNRETGELAVGTPGGALNTFFRPKYNEKKNTQDMELARAYFDAMKAKEAYEEPANAESATHSQGKEAAQEYSPNTSEAIPQQSEVRPKRRKRRIGAKRKNE